MGGYFSTRWNHKQTRRTTAGALKLDVRRLARDGSLQPGAMSTLSWTRADGEPAGTITTIMDREQSRLVLVYATQRSGETAWTDHKTPVNLDTTSCTYGGSRWWFRCPGCAARRAVLYCVNGVFACTGCHDLAYASTRQEAWERGDHRIREIANRLGYTGREFPFRLPTGGKPKGMWWSTYEKLVQEFLALHAARNRYFAAQAAALHERIDTLLARKR